MLRKIISIITLSILLVGQIIPFASAQVEYDTIIVGAGMSGLTAANELQSNGKNILVLEARGDDRIGGRTFTNTTLGFHIDEGASWIHGIDGNPIVTLADEANLTRAHTDEDSTTIYDFDGTELDRRQTIIWNFAYEFEHFIESQYERNDAFNVNPTYEELINKFIETKSLAPENVTNLNILVSFDQAIDYASDPKQMSINNHYMGYRINEQEQNDVVFAEGYSGIVDHLVDKIGKDKILTNNVVSKIEYDQNRVLVTTNQGTYTAKHVIVTVPIGVLEQGVIEFSPELPDSKTKAIENLEMGVMNKNFLIFDSSNVFWENKENEEYNYDFIHILTEDEPVPGFLYVNFYKHTGEPILMAFTSGEYARNLESLTDEEIVAKLMKPLQAKYKEAPNKPENAFITRWSSDPYSYGSYSYMGIGASLADYYEMRETVQNRIYFAGEGTSDYPGTVHGAYFSGMYQVDKILNPEAPNKQMDGGVSLSFVLCKEGLQLITLDDRRAGCVFEDTAQKLVLRGWVKVL
jgi:monoamine oxidase